MRHVALVAILLQILCGSVGGDTYVVRLDPAARDQPATGRVILFFITETGGRWPFRNPIDGPFFENPQPIASLAVAEFQPGDSVTLDGSVFAFPASLDTLNGPVRVQAILDADQTERCHDVGPGNVYSDVASVELSATEDDTVHLTLSHRISPREPFKELENLKWVRFRSELLSEFYGRDVDHKAGVALPKGYGDPNHPRQEWPAVYVIPGFGGREEGATRYAGMLKSLEAQQRAPVAVYIVLDPESPLGHHGFVDSPNHGPRGRALIDEFIPHLESQFRLIAKSEARIVTGHSSGGWSSLWLQLNHPEVFGACWSSAPDPVDFSAFQMTNLYEHANLYIDAEGIETPSYRRLDHSSSETQVRMTVRQECRMEYAIDPTGCSGQQWDTWEAMFSPRDENSGLPKPMFDPLSGSIDEEVVAHWSRFDIARMVIENWDRCGPIAMNRVRLVCGEKDSFYLNRAVERFDEKVELLRAETPGNGYILMVKGADHGTVLSAIRARWDTEMRDYLRASGFQD